VTRVDFHVNAPDTLGYACRLVRKAYRAGQRVVVFADDPARLASFDQALWSFSQFDFIPHVLAGDRLAARTPVVLASADTELPHHEVLVNLGARLPPPFFARFERLIEVVGSGDDDRGPARARFRFYKDRGYPVQTHDLANA